MAAGRYGDAQRRVQIRELTVLWGYYGFHALDLSEQSPMLFVDLLARPGHQGEVLREPRLCHHLRISTILLHRQHCPTEPSERAP